MINNIIDGRSASSIINEARAFAKSATSTTEWYTPLAGVTVNEAVSLGINIDLIPWADVPDSYQKTIFGSKLTGPRMDLSMPFFLQMRATANSAIRIRSEVCQVLFSSNNEVKADAKTLADEINAGNEQIQDVVRCITALSAHAVVTIGSWKLLDQKMANGIFGTGYSHGWELFENAVRTASSKPVALEGELITGPYHRFENFETYEKNVMRVALDRLNQALRKQNIVDKAIDLGIALEVMLLHGIGKNDRGELRFRSSVRGATFLGGDKEERLKNFKLLKDAYDLRSKAVHSGVLKKKKKRTPPEKVLEDATRACASIALKIIDRGSFPDWDADYVIGG